MKPQKIFLILMIVLLSACSGPARDTKLEAAVSNLVTADQIIALDSSGQVIVNISTQTAFKMEPDERKKLAERIANEALTEHSDAETILISFGRTKPAIEQIAYAWKVDNGNLVPMQIKH